MIRGLTMKTLTSFALAAALALTLAPVASAQSFRGNAVRIEQAGSNNAAATVQNGSDNLARIDQRGNDNNGRIVQTGSRNRACLYQRGNGLGGAIEQTGNNQSTVAVQTNRGVRVGQGHVIVGRAVYQCR